jgi:hypothetical protein
MKFGFWLLNANYSKINKISVACIAGRKGSNANHPDLTSNGRINANFLRTFLLFFLKDTP